MPIRNSIAATFFLVAWIAGAAADGFYDTVHRSPPLLFRFAWGVVLTWSAFTWLKRDSFEKKLPLPFDMGFFLCIFWPFIGPWHLYRSRGIKGLVWLLPIVGTYAAFMYFGHHMAIEFVPVTANSTAG